MTDLNLVVDFGADPTGVACSSAALQAAFDHPSGGLPGAGIRGHKIIVPPGRYRLTKEVVAQEWCGSVEGSGSGVDPMYTGNLGGASVFFWDGAAGAHMITVRDSDRPTFLSFRIEGNDAAVPASGIRYHMVAAEDQKGTNARLRIEDCHFGVYPWPHVGATYKGKLAVGLLVSGDNANNDEMHISRCTFSGNASDTTSFGVSIPGGTQTVWSHFIDCLFDGVGTGISTAASVQMTNPSFNACQVRDIDVLSSATVKITGYQSERSRQFVRIAGNYGKIFVDWGRLQCSHLPTTSGAIMDLYPAHQINVDFKNVEFFQVPVKNAAQPTIRWGWTSRAPANHSGFYIRFDKCSGLRNEHIEAPTGMTINTRGILEWDMREGIQASYGNDAVVARNHFRGTAVSGTTRTTMDLGAYDLPGRPMLVISNMPVSNPHQAGALWNDRGTVKISAG